MEFPEVSKIILSGQSEKQHILRSVFFNVPGTLPVIVMIIWNPGSGVPNYYMQYIYSGCSLKVPLIIQEKLIIISFSLLSFTLFMRSLILLKAPPLSINWHSYSEYSVPG